jgi:LacI family transcriptional regulator, repressor for deo operon, udp, cdd, tsx, nupC, and nupG
MGDTKGVRAGGPTLRVITPARIKDVAALAGVSMKTVTNVMHERPYVRGETRQRVLDAIEELDYRPSLAGRQLRGVRSNILTMAVPRVDEPYLGALSHAIISAATERGFTVLVDETGGRPAHEKEAVEGYPGHGIDGVIFSPLAADPEHLAATSTRRPLVLLGEPLANGSADYVAIDNTASARDVVRHLLERGRRRIGFLGAQPDRPSAVGELRRETYVEELARAGIQARRSWQIVTNDFSRDSGAELVRRMLRRRSGVDALICASDLLAIGALRSLRDAGVRVPNDVAVVGWDDIVDGRWSSPTLTTVSTDLAYLADQALDALIRRIDGDRSPGRTIVVPHRLISRGSTNAP